MLFHYGTVLTFWISCGLLVYTFCGYGWLISALARWRPQALSSPDAAGSPPSVGVVLVACNEETPIVERLRNLLTSRYPPEKLQVLLVSDGSTDATVAQARTIGDARLEIIECPDRAGKAAGLNLALSGCTAEIVIFTDARQRFDPEAIARLAAHFADPAIGAVSGELEIASAASVTGSGVDAYWRYERSLRAAESRFDSCIGCTGAIYALRRSLFVPIPEDTLLDDVVIPLQAAVQGARVIHDSTALAHDPRPLEPKAELRRKQRTLAGGFQMAFRYPQWLAPGKNRLWWQLLSHKYLRLLGPFFLVAAFLSNFELRGSFFYDLSLAAQVALYIFAGLGMAGWRTRLGTLASGFVFLNAMTVMGLIYYTTRNAQRGWR
ncbi:MAG: glycosyltransferase family 2 protein [Chthoniobacter sp.]|uniref:glycosyltransferase family 2 protein n=1 Tax=Chthoniobacter sp. TaxID=2510640 RepID=UPI0032A88BAC